MKFLNDLRLKIYYFLMNKTKIKGKNNIIDIKKSCKKKKLKIYLYGNNNKILIEDNADLHNVNLRIGFHDAPINDCTIKIGKKTTFNRADIQLGESGSNVIIGEDCMFSYNIELACSDTHSILDDSQKLINIGEFIQIGNHVWVGKDAKIMKNTVIADNSIVAQGSIVTKKFDKPNSIIAGIPAKIVKENINWSRKRPEELLKSDN